MQIESGTSKERAWTVGMLILFSSVLMLGSNGRAGEMVRFKNTMDQETAGYIALPDGAEEAPAILVIHEWWGLTDWVKEQADRLAERGYVALAVDLYDGKATDDPGEAHELMRALDQSEAIHDLKGAIAYLATRSEVADQPFGAIGWCMGGLYSRLSLQNSDRIGPAVICYGSITADPTQVEAASGRPVLGIFGAQDRGIPASRVRQYFDALEEAGSEVDLKIYDNAGHAFMRPGGSQYVAESAQDAWMKIDNFFAKYLKD